MTAKESQRISRHTLMWLLITNIAILTPLYEQVTLWSLSICAICIFWRIGIYLGKVAKPPKWLVTSLAFASATTLAMVAAQIGVLTAMVNLLILGYALKYIEMRNRRDVRAVVLVGYFLIAFTFIQQQTLLSTLHLLVVTAINTCVLISLYHDEGNFKYAATLGSKIIFQSLPLAIILFLVLPRLPPLWMVPPQNGAQTGLSDNVSFGDISQLTRSSELAFRATFETGAPSNDKLYWRAIVMEDYDGQNWTQNPRFTNSYDGLPKNQPAIFAEQASAQSVNPPAFPLTQTEAANPTSTAITYSVIAEPSAQQWLFGLDVATSNDKTIRQRADHTLYANKPIDQRRIYQVTSFDNRIMDPLLSAESRAINLALPKAVNPQTRELADKFAISYPVQEDRLNAMMRYFTQQPYFYTLRPPRVGKQQIDDFLIYNKAGFCVHYASAFAFMARATGIPARLVTGYQGAEFNPAAGYYSIYQYMAHAWVEVWLPNLGWVRFDPTAMIAPERVEQGFDAFFDPETTYLLDNPFSALGYRDNAALNQLRMHVACVDYFWSVWVLGFNSQKQQRVLEEILGEVTQTKLAIFILISLCVIGLAIAYSAGLIQFHRSSDKHLNAYYSVCKMLRQRGLSREYHEGPQDYNLRVAAAFPAIAEDFDKLTQYFVAIKYQKVSKRALKRFSRLLIKQSRWLKINIIKQRLALNKTNT
ncbi:transglutaminase TgpA family protein [Shewanella sp. 0m-4]